jgi:hypothetical protein
MANGSRPVIEPARPSRYLSAYGEVRFVIALPIHATWRPFVGTSGSWVVSQFGEAVQRASIDVGLTWLGW